MSKGAGRGALTRGPRENRPILRERLVGVEVRLQEVIAPKCRAELVEGLVGRQLRHDVDSAAERGARTTAVQDGVRSLQNLDPLDIDERVAISGIVVSRDSIEPLFTPKTANAYAVIG